MRGHGVSLPRVHIAGHAPGPTGMRARTSKSTIAEFFFTLVFTEADVYSIVGRERRQSDEPSSNIGLGRRVFARLKYEAGRPYNMRYPDDTTVPHDYGQSLPHSSIRCR